jgi:FeS assembly SUF system regulator
VIRLSRLADYGIVLTTQVARHPARHWSAPDLASATGIPLPTTSKLLKTLVRAGVLVSHRGAKGGYGLACATERVSVARVIEAVEGPIAITSCLDPNGAECGIDAFCPARTNWHTINHAIRVALEAVSIDEMARAVPAAFLEAGTDAQDQQHALAGDPKYLTA